MEMHAHPQMFDADLLEHFEARTDDSTGLIYP
jgi:hypothetical protein